LLAFAVLALAGQLYADPPEISDLRDEVAAHKALTEDATLAKLGLLVKVRKHVATVTGTVPSRELAQRAVNCLNKLPELIAVRDAIHVEGEEVVPPILVQQKKPPLWSGTLTDHSNEPRKVVVWVPLGQKSVAMSPALNPVEAVSRSKDASTKKPSEPADAAAIVSAVKNLMVGEERYRRLRFEVKQNKVYLTGVVYQWADLHELSRAIARIPGVEAVVLQDVRAEPKK
jgi:osmotically-inducible protein OsmY